MKVNASKKGKTMKAILEFDLSVPEENEAHIRAIKSTAAYSALWEIADDIFRPHRKHGYVDEKLSKYLNNENKEVSEAVYETISRLEELFYETLTDNNINLFEELS